MAEKILSGEFKAGDTIKIGCLKDNEEFTFMKVQVKPKKEANKEDKKLVKAA